VMSCFHLNGKFKVFRSGMKSDLKIEFFARNFFKIKSLYIVSKTEPIISLKLCVLRFSPPSFPELTLPHEKSSV